MQWKGLKYAQGPESITVAAASKSAVVTFPSLTHPNAAVSREPQQRCDEPSAVNLAQHNNGSGDFHYCWQWWQVAQVSLPTIKVTPWHLCRLEKLVMAKATFQGFL